MNQHITCLKNIGSVVYESQNNVVEVAKRLNFNELGLYHFDSTTDNDNELSHRMDGIIGSVGWQDITIFQYPSWMGRRYDQMLIQKLKAYNHKLIIWVQDIDTLLWGNNTNLEEDIRAHVALLNQADLLILASEELHKFLVKYGLTVSKIIYQTVWEIPQSSQPTNHEKMRRLLCTSADCFNDYAGNIPIYQFSSENRSDKNSKVTWMGWMNTAELIAELSKGGFGICWSDDFSFDLYDRMNQPYKLASYIAAGIPFFVRRGCAHEEFVRKNNLGFVVDSIEEMSQIVENISDDEYDNLYNSVKEIQTLCSKGWYTSKTLTDSVIRVMEK